MATFEARDAVIVIMAGGAGERFWPLSSRTVPKQLLRIHQGRTLLDLAFSRATGLVPRDRVFVVAGTHLRDSILKALPDLAPANLIEEPVARNTAACLGLAAAVIESRFGARTVMGVLTADHLIEDLSLFRDTVGAAMAHAAGSDDLVTIGMEPTRPETAFGYLELGERIREPADGLSVFQVVRFTEKPALDVAESFLRRGNYLWNSGMFFWKVSTLFAAFEKFQPATVPTWEALRRAGDEAIASEAFNRLFAALPSMPIDTAIMEHASNVVAVRGGFRWEDVGSWDALARVNEGDAEGNRIFGESVVFESANNIVYNDAAAEGDASVVLFGVEDLVVVRSGKVMLVMPKSRSQDLKKLLKSLQEQGRNDLL